MSGFYEATQNTIKNLSAFQTYATSKIYTTLQINALPRLAYYLDLFTLDPASSSRRASYPETSPSSLRSRPRIQEPRCPAPWHQAASPGAPPQRVWPSSYSPACPESASVPSASLAASVVGAAAAAASAAASISDSSSSSLSPSRYSRRAS